MNHANPRFDAQMELAPAFAKPILAHLRKVMHAALPEVEEDLKWRHPAFMYKGMFAGMAAFKQHCTFGFWKHALLLERLSAADCKAMASFDRITSLDDLPSDKTLMRIIKTAARLNDEGVKPARRKVKRAPDRVVEVPPDLAAALKNNAAARAGFADFSYSHKKEYLEWLADAKTEATRERRLATAIAWIAAGKPRNWKYMRK